MSNPVARSIDAAISIDGKVLAGQQDAILKQSAQAIDITNKINPEWQENLSGTKMWNINCNGCYVLNEESLEKLENAFLNNQTVEVSIIIGNYTYKGNAILVSFPLNTTFSQSVKYNINLLGTGELQRIK